MSLRKRCGRNLPRLLRSGEPNPLYCGKSPRCEHHWHYDFRVNGRRYRASTETADKHKARDIEATERTRILEGRHGIRRQPDIAFNEFAKTFLRDHADINKRSAERDRWAIKVLNRSFGSTLLHEITAHRIEQFKRDRLAGKWSAFRQKTAPKPVRPASVNRELDTLKSILSKAVAWGKLRENPARAIKRLKVDNRRTRILTADEQQRLLAACRTNKLRAIVSLALLTGARIGELLSLRWEDTADGLLTFLKTKTGKPRTLPISPTIRAILDALPRHTLWVFPSTRTGKPYQSIRKTFERIVDRAEITTGDVTLHTLRHTALSRMIAAGFDDYTVMEISGHSTTRMLARYTHPTARRKVAALESIDADLVTNWSQPRDDDAATDPELAELLRKVGGRQGDRTPDLCIANAALSQLS